MDFFGNFLGAKQLFGMVSCEEKLEIFFNHVMDCEPYIWKDIDALYDIKLSKIVYSVFMDYPIICARNCFKIYQTSRFKNDTSTTIQGFRA